VTGPRKTHCVRGHLRTPDNITLVGACKRCRNEREAQRSKLGAATYDFRASGTLKGICGNCGHRLRGHEPECYHAGPDGQFDCDCTRPESAEGEQCYETAGQTQR
jgi:hypothetical protein